MWWARLLANKEESLERDVTEKPILGIDLAGSPKRPTGICILSGTVVETVTVLSDEEILKIAKETSPVLCSIDAPLSLPPRRKSLEDRNGEHLRPCDRELQKMVVRFFPITIGPMRMLTQRGLALKDQLADLGYDSVESYPGGAQDVWGIPRKQHGLEGLGTVYEVWVCQGYVTMPTTTSWMLCPAHWPHNSSSLAMA